MDASSGLSLRSSWRSVTYVTSYLMERRVNTPPGGHLSIGHGMNGEWLVEQNTYQLECPITKPVQESV